jgi:hypothetical protein
MAHKFILEVILSTITFIIAHVTYRVLGYFAQYFEAGASHLLRLHIKDAHGGRFKYCDEGQCSTQTVAESPVLLVFREE